MRVRRPFFCVCRRIKPHFSFCSMANADADVCKDPAATAPLAAREVPRLSLSSHDDVPRPSAAQLAMKNALKTEIGGSSEQASTSSTDVALTASICPAEELVEGPSTPNSSRAVVEAENDTCSICTSTLGENGGTLSLLCGEFFFKIA